METDMYYLLDIIKIIFIDSDCWLSKNIDLSFYIVIKHRSYREFNTSTFMYSHSGAQKIVNKYCSGKSNIIKRRYKDAIVNMNTLLGMNRIYDDYQLC